MSALKKTIAVQKRCFETTSWQNYLHEKRRPVGGAVEKSESALVNGLQNHLRENESADIDWSDLRSESKLFGLETFSRLYNDPARVDSPSGPAFHKLAHDLMEQVDEFQQLKNSVEGDPDLAALAAAQLVETVTKEIPDLLNAKMEQDELDRQREEDQSDGEGSSETQNGPSPMELQSAKFRNNIRKAIQKEVSATNEVKESLSAMVPGSGSAPSMDQQDNTKRMELAQKLRENDKLKKVLKLAGRLRRSVERKSQSKVAGCEEVVDIERGKDLSRILPSELSKLSHPIYKKMFLRDYIEGRCLQYRLVGSEPMDRGPIVVLLDESGSMDGARHEWARAIGVACISIAVKQKREVVVIGFSGMINDIVQIEKSGESYGYSVESGTTLSIDDAKHWTGRARIKAGGALEAAGHVASRGCGGGTDFDDPITAGLAFCKDSNADMIIVTDGEAWCSDITFDDVACQKEETGLSIFGITIGGGNMSVLGELCDRVTDIDEDAATVDQVSGAMF